MSINEIIFGDAKFTVDVIEACTKFDIDISVGGQTEISMVFSDPGFRLLDANVFQRKTLFQWKDLKCEVAVIEAGDTPAPQGVQIKARSYAAQKFKRNKEAVVRRNISPTNWLIAEANTVGATVVGQASAARSQIVRINTENEQQSTWDVMTTLAGELGYLFFECAGVFYFGQPSWLVTRASAKYGFVWPDNEDTSTISILKTPSCRASENAKEAATVDVLVDRAIGTSLRPGDPVTFSGVPLFAGTYMVSGVSWSEIHPSEPVSVSLTTPIDPEKNTKTAKKQKAITEADGPALLIDAAALTAWEASA